MMSDKDGPPGGAVSVAVSAATSTAQNTTDSDMRQVWRFVYVDMSFVKSIPGLLLAGELILSLLCIISVSIPDSIRCNHDHGGTYSYVEFTSSSCLITCIIWYCLYLFAITKKVGFIRWDISQLIWCAFYVFNYFIGSCVLAAHVCDQGGYKAATAFGFLCLIVLLVDGFLTFRGVYSRYKEGKSSASGSSQQETPKEAEEAQY